MQRPVGLTVLIPTFNEEKNLRDCLECVKWADQIIVIDSFSTDKTLEIAREYTDEVHQHEYVNSATQKNWALSNLPLRGRWTLIVDADERVTAELAAEIQEVVRRDDKAYVGYFINRRNYFFGQWLRHGGLYPNWNLRLFQTGQGRYEDKEVHADVAILGEGRVGYLTHDMLHYSYRTISDFVRKTDRYTTWEACERLKLRHDDSAVSTHRGGTIKRLVRQLYRALPGKPMVRFLYSYVLQRGLLDGRWGLITSGLYAFEELLIGAKMWEQRCAMPRRVGQPDADRS